HARQRTPPPGGTPGDRRSALRAPPPRRPPKPPPNPPERVTYVPTQERPITRDICPEPRHLLRHCRVVGETRLLQEDPHSEPLVGEHRRHALESDLHHLPAQARVERLAGVEAHRYGRAEHLLAEPPGGSRADLVVAVGVVAHRDRSRRVARQGEWHLR